MINDAIFRPPSWENRNAKAARLLKKIRNGEKVSRWEVFPLRFKLIKLAGNDWDLVDKINLLIDEARGSF